MAIVELGRGVIAATQVENESAMDTEVDVRLDVHDASRIEWSVTVPLPEKDESKAKYTIDVELEIPANVFARHSPWDQLQSWTRLDGPAETIRSGEVTIDAIRRGAIAFAHRLARASEGFSRHCRLAGALFASAPSNELEDGLDLWIGVATATSEQARERLVDTPPEGAELMRERRLVDEYISIRLLEMLAGAERALHALQASRSAFAACYAEAITRVESRLAEQLEREIAYRATRGFLTVDPTSSGTLEQYLDRSSRLKKHFQEVLFLEPETFRVAERIHHWVAAFVAILASTWAFAWQIALTQQRPTTGSKVGSGIVVLAVIAGVIYAAKDRIKELGRTWISGNVHRFYAQRIARWRAPSRRLPTRDVVVSARESFDESVTTRPDPLNPECGAAITATIVRFTHKGQVIGRSALAASGVRRVKHIFRYDLSPLFARLDDAVKQVPVLDPVTRKVKFTGAPRCYRVPVRLQVTAGRTTRDARATLVLHKRGLDRLEFESDLDGKLDTGVLPL